MASSAKSVLAQRRQVDVVLHHHEAYNGEGYPLGLRGRTIPLGARIIAVAESYVKMTMDRPYRKALGKAEALESLAENAFQVHVLTKSDLVLRDLELFVGQKARIGVTVTTLDESLRVHWEPRAASVEDRFRVLEEASRLGLKTAIMFGPLLPWLSDSQDSLNAMFQRAADLQVEAGQPHLKPLSTGCLGEPRCSRRPVFSCGAHFPGKCPV